MLSVEQNNLITRVGPGTPCGTLMRRYWQPAALVEEFDSRRPVRPVRLLGENLVLFRDEKGRYCLMDRDCPHRGADLSFGRCEDGGLRCTFHGWLFDATGQCIETPAEPEGSPLARNIKQRTYPVIEKSGILWAYMGPGEPPAFPAFDCFTAPDTHAFAFKGLWECNWLQALEVGIDPAHASFLHRFFDDDARNDATQFRDKVAGSDTPITKLLRESWRPKIEVEQAAHGLKIVTTRPAGEGRVHVRVTNQVFPHGITIPLAQDMIITQWHVPIDDHNCYWYTIFTSYGRPLDKATMRAQRLATYELPEYRSRLNRTNNYGFDVDDQLRRTYTGLGEDINVQDQWAVESLGAIQDRTREHLGASDKAIIAYRRLLVKAIEQAARGERPVMVFDAATAAGVTGPLCIDGLAAEAEVTGYPEAADRARRAQSPWGATAASGGKS